MRAETEWISVKDLKPKKGVLVIIAHAEDEWVCCGEYAGKNIWYNQFSDDDVNVTHWQPLPNPPKDLTTNNLVSSELSIKETV